MPRRSTTRSKTIRPDEIYNLGAQSHVRVSFDIPEYTADVTGMGAVRVLEAMRELGLDARFYQASSSEMYGAGDGNRRSAKRRRSIRAARTRAAKAYAFHITRNYREAYGMFAVNGILFNHESPRRGETFVTRKISRAAARIKLGKQERLYLGNLDAQRDWGFAGDYVEAMWLMLQADEPDDYVIATGESHSVREFCELCFAEVGLPLAVARRGRRTNRASTPTGRVLVAIDPRHLRPTDVADLRGDATKAREKLGWQPHGEVPRAGADDGRARPAAGRTIERLDRSRPRMSCVSKLTARSAPFFPSPA